MKVSDYINPAKKKPWTRLVKDDSPSNQSGTKMKVMTQQDFLNEVCSAAHEINSQMMSRRPIYGPTGDKDKNGKEKWAIVGYDEVETIPISKQWEIISKKISHFAGDGFWTASESASEDLFQKMMSWADTAGMKTAFIEAIWHCFRTGDSAVYWYQSSDNDDPLQYEVYGYEEGSVLFPSTDINGRETLARKYKFNGHDAVDIFTPEKIETWMMLDKNDEDYKEFVQDEKKAEVSEDGYTLVRSKDAQAGDRCQCVYFRVSDIPSGVVQPSIDKLEDAKTYVGEHLKGTSMPILFMKAEKTTSLPPSSLANKIIGVKGTADSLAHADAKFLAPPDASNIADLHINGLESDIRDGAMSVKIDPDVIKQGSDSSATMKILYAPEIQWCQIHWPEIFKSVKQMMLVFKALVGKVEGKATEYSNMRISVGQEIWIPQNAAEALKMELDQVYARVKSRRSAMEDIGNAHIGDGEQIEREWEWELTKKAEAGPKAKAKFGDTADTGGNSGDEPKDNPADVNNQAPGKSIQN
jgi:hypothetical protein